jgi:hypothetical protein
VSRAGIGDWRLKPVAGACIVAAIKKSIHQKETAATKTGDSLRGERKRIAFHFCAVSPKRGILHAD